MQRSIDRQILNRTKKITITNRHMVVGVLYAPLLNVLRYFCTKLLSSYALVLDLVQLIRKIANILSDSLLSMLF
ncbi:hypothetical protein BpHYR1_049079 [Brachionus plicatilis]|uniref:Uncharacterized protein n=1 Tax=Brachionus plicatilis TaxID=10195 RepID=A0A3M7Q1L6_BRAPC|nr:hypothetical protein BpHYR1_049079 [Brachionus plicatilis]